MSGLTTDVDFDLVDPWDWNYYVINSRNSAESRAKLRRLTLYFRRIHSDNTRDKISSPTALYVFVSGKYRHIFTRRRFPSIIEYKGDRTITWHKIRQVHYNITYGTISVLVDGVPGYKWFYIPRELYPSSGKIHTYELVGMSGNSGATLKVVDYLSFSYVNYSLVNKRIDLE